MKLYIIRHAESVSNVTKLNAGQDSPLSEKGIHQAKEIGEQLAHTDFSIIYTSPCARSKQTGELINSTRNKSVQIFESKLIDEKREATSLLNLKRDEMPWDIIKKNRHNPDWHFEDEESFSDINNRASQFLELLKSYNEDDQVLIISHHSFIKHLILQVLLQQELEPTIFYKIAERMETKNTGITILEKKQKYFESSPSWYLSQWMA